MDRRKIPRLAEGLSGWPICLTPCASRASRGSSWAGAPQNQLFVAVFRSMDGFAPIALSDRQISCRTQYVTLTVDA
jgi:hypothetical protein